MIATDTKAAKTLLSKLEEAVLAIKNAMKGATWGRLNTRDLEQSYKAFDLWMTGLSNAIEKAENTAVQTDETAESDDGMERNSLIGINDYGIEVYETSQETRRLSWNERKARYRNMIIREYAGRTARFEKNGRYYYASFSRKDVRKAIYGELRSDAAGRDALINAGADGDVFDLVEYSKFYRDSPDKKSHKQTDYFDYFLKTVQIDGKVFDVLVDVKKQYSNDDGYVYTITLTENDTVKALPAPSDRKSELVNTAGERPTDSKSQTPEPVKPEISPTSNTMLQKDETIHPSLIFPDADAALDILDGMDIDQLADLSADAFRDVKTSGPLSQTHNNRFVRILHPFSSVCPICIVAVALQDDYYSSPTLTAGLKNDKIKKIVLYELYRLNLCH